MKPITVVDAIMGKGKTSWALEYINESPAYKKFIYITPFLDEVKRVKETVTNRKFHEPTVKNSDGRKLTGLKQLIVEGRDIAATHSLFQMADDELIELLTDSGYTLILDEVMDVIEAANVKMSDISRLNKSGDIEVVGNKVVWIGDPFDDGRYADIRMLAQAGNLFYHRNKWLIWSFPPQVFKAFENVFVLTYLFRAQIQRYYYDLHQIPYEFKSVDYDGGKYVLTDYNTDAENRSEVMKLIDVYEGKLNSVGERRNALSKRYLDNASADMHEEIQKNLYNYFRNITKAGGKDIIWTTLKGVKGYLQGRGYTKAFIPLNMRATNDYADRWALAYVYNRYMNPVERSFFEDNGVTVNQELLAVSDLLQWIWRSRIRKGEPINLYLPSIRMRELLYAWGRNEL